MAANYAFVSQSLYDDFDLGCFSKDIILVSAVSFMSSVESVLTIIILVEYTVMAEMGNREASALISRNSARNSRLPNSATFCRAELYAITDFIRRIAESNFIILATSYEWITVIALEIINTHLTNTWKTVVR